MEITVSRSTVRQPEKIIGPTVTIINTDETVTQEKDEQGTEYTLYSYTQYRFDVGEVELIQIGSLPSGVEWDEQLRSIEREHLYAEAEKYTAKYRDDVADPDKLALWIAYKASVRSTPSQPGYPAVVEYPARPE
ncbi:MAG: hypothetical protein E7Z65_06490 [Thermoplasmata archaeon]|jgi:hypothetical protein|nr:hypothetical protein [Thermoplasmata archaeon]